MRNFFVALLMVASLILTLGGAKGCFDNEPPVLDPPGTYMICEGKIVEFTATATDPDGDDLEFSAGGLPARATFSNNGHFYWRTIFSEAGSYSILITVTDGEEEDTGTASLFVQECGYLERVVFSRDGDLWATEIGAEEADRLTDSLAAAADPRISPDGNLVAFVDTLDGDLGTDVGLLDLHTGAIQTVVTNLDVGADDLERPTWDDRSEKLIFTGGHKVHSISASGGDHQTLIDYGFETVGHYIPHDNTKMIYLNRFQPSARLERYDFGDQSSTVLLDLADFAPHDLDMSDDGQWILTVMNGTLIKVMKDGTGLFPLGGTGQPVYPVWASTVNEDLIYTNEADGSIWMMSSTGARDQMIIEMGLYGDYGFIPPDYYTIP